MDRGMSGWVRGAAIAIAATWATVLAAADDLGKQVALPERAGFFAEPGLREARLAAEGDRVGWIADTPDGLQLTIAPIEGSGDGPGGSIGLGVSRPVGRPLDGIVTAWDFVRGGRSAVVEREDPASGRRSVVVVRLDDGTLMPLEPVAGASTSLLALDHTHADAALLEVRVGGGKPEAWIADTTTGAVSISDANHEGFSALVPDSAWTIRGGLRVLADGSAELAVRGPDGSWSTAAHLSADERAGARVVAMPDATGRAFVVLSSRDPAPRTGGLFEFRPTHPDPSRRWRLLATNDWREVGRVIVDRNGWTPRLVESEWLITEWKALELGLEPDVGVLRKADDGRFVPAGQSLDDRRWLVRFERTSGGIGWWLLLRGDPSRAYPLLDAWDGRAVERERPLINVVSAKVPDGRRVPIELSVPADGPGRTDSAREPPNLPMVVIPIAGQRALNGGWLPIRSWLLSRGYVVAITYLGGSDGHGPAMARAGGAAVDDLIAVLASPAIVGVAATGRIAVVDIGQMDSDWTWPMGFAAPPTVRLVEGGERHASDSAALAVPLRGGRATLLDVAEVERFLGESIGGAVTPPTQSDLAETPVPLLPSDAIRTFPYHDRPRWRPQRSQPRRQACWRVSRSRR